MTKKVTVTVFSGIQRNREIQFEQDLITVGRNPDNDIVLENVAVSGSHAKIDLEKMTVTDLGSTNGTFIGEERVTLASLNFDQPIAIGKFRIIVCEAATTDFHGDKATLILKQPQGAPLRGTAVYSADINPSHGSKKRIFIVVGIVIFIASGYMYKNYKSKQEHERIAIQASNDRIAKEKVRVEAGKAVVQDLNSIPWSEREKQDTIQSATESATTPESANKVRCQIEFLSTRITYKQFSQVVNNKKTVVEAHNACSSPNDQVSELNTPQILAKIAGIKEQIISLKREIAFASRNAGTTQFPDLMVKYAKEERDLSMQRIDLEQAAALLELRLKRFVLLDEVPN